MSTRDKQRWKEFQKPAFSLSLLPFFFNITVRKKKKGKQHPQTSHCPETKEKRKKKKTIFIHFHFHFHFILIEEREGRNERNAREKGVTRRVLHFQKNSSVYFPRPTAQKKCRCRARILPRLRTDGGSLSLRQKGVRGVFFSGAVDT